MSRLLNLGCGRSYHEAWTNVDFTPRPPHVLGYDLTYGVPFPDDLFDAVYHSHLLEHFSRQGAALFLRECLRVLRPGGILRVAVPDLEGIARAYLRELEAAQRGEPDADARHAWMTIELLDQLARHRSGGEMRAFWNRDPVPAGEFVLSRVGEEARQAIAAAGQGDQGQPSGAHPYDVGRFRLSGECHLWMYDRHSLERLLRETGFEQVRPASASQSAIEGFAGYGLDTMPDGGVRKPDSLFMEARKPEAALRAAPRVVGFCMQHFGGAGGAALRLHQGLRAIDVPSFLYVLNSDGPLPGVAVIPATGETTLTRDADSGRLANSSWQDYRAASKARLAHYPRRPAHCEIFSDMETRTRIAAIPGIDAAQIVHLHWIPGTVDIAREVAFLRGRPVVWTLHDMNPITGGCHYAESCRGFERYCGRCPQLGSDDEKDYSREQWVRKKVAYRELDITVVCPSRWLADEVRRSSLLGKAPVRVIPNGVPTDVFKPLNRKAIRTALGIKDTAFVVLFGCDYLDTRRKGFQELRAALEALRDAPGAQDLLLLTFGTLGGLDASALPFRCLHLGALQSPQDVALAYNAADCVVIASLEDNLPNVVLEALSCGLPVAGFATGGIPDMVEDGAVGRLAARGDAAALAEAVASLRRMTPEAMQRMRLRCRQVALSRYTLLQQARAYEALYRELLEAARRPGT